MKMMQEIALTAAGVEIANCIAQSFKFMVHKLPADPVRYIYNAMKEKLF